MRRESIEQCRIWIDRVDFISLAFKPRALPSWKLFRLWRAACPVFRLIESFWTRPHRSRTKGYKRVWMSSKMLKVVWISWITQRSSLCPYDGLAVYRCSVPCGPWTMVDSHQCDTVRQISVILSTGYFASVPGTAWLAGWLPDWKQPFSPWDFFFMIKISV